MILADHEFIGKAWLQFLFQQKGWDFVIRIRCNSWVSLDDGQLRYLATVTRHWKRATTRSFFNMRLYGFLHLKLVVHRPKKGDPLCW